MPHFRLPTANAWLVRLVQPTVQFAGQIETIIARPEIQELLAAAPQAGRIFRPLYRMLGIPLPPSLRLPARPRRPRPAKVAPAVKPLSARARQRLLNYSPGRIGETHRRLAPYRQEFSPA